MSGISRAAESSPVIHTLRSSLQSEERTPVQESATTEKVSDSVECILCCAENIYPQTPALIHRTNQKCDLYINKQVCHICLPKLERCPICRENLTTGEMQNALADNLSELLQGNSRVLAEESEEEHAQLNPSVNIPINVHNVNPPQEQQNRLGPARSTCKGICIAAAIITVFVGGFFFGWLEEP